MQPPQDLVTRDDADLLEILHDFAAAELRGAELAIPADARPAFPALRTTQTGCVADSRAATSAVPSGEPSSTTTSSQVWPAIALARRSTRGGSDPASL